MPRLPTYRRKILPSARIGAAPLPRGAARQAGGAVGEGLAAVGRGVGDIGQALFKIEREKQAIRNDAAYADAVRAENTFAINKENELRSRVYKNTTEAAQDRLEAANQLNTFRESQAGNMSATAFGKYSNWSKVNEKTRLRTFEGRIYENEVALVKGQAKIGLSDAYGVLYDPLSTIQQKQIAQESIATIRKGTEKYFAQGQFNIIEKETQIATLSEAGQFDKARELVRKSPEVYDAKQRLAKLHDIDVYENRAKAARKLSNEIAIEAVRQEIDSVFILPQDEFLIQVPNTLNTINSSKILTVKDKESQRAKINKRLDAIAKGKIDPVDEFDPKAYDNLSIRISRNSKSVKPSEIGNLVGKGKVGGLTVSQAEELTRLKKFYDGADVIGNSLHRTYTGAITGLRTAKAFSRNKNENVELAAQARSVLNAWAVQHPDATEDDYAGFFNRLIDNSRMNTWGRGWFTREIEENRVAIRENLQELKEELDTELVGIEREYKKGDTRIITGVTYTFDGKVWND